MDEIFIIAAARSKGLPKPCKAVDERMFFDLDEASAEAEKLNHEYGYGTWRIYRALVKVVGKHHIDRKCSSAVLVLMMAAVVAVLGWLICTAWAVIGW